jgi:hypothetical protein
MLMTDAYADAYADAYDQYLSLSWIAHMGIKYNIKSAF